MLAWTSSGGRGFQLGWAGLGWETAVNLIGFGEHRAHSAGGGGVPSTSAFRDALTDPRGLLHTRCGRGEAEGVALFLRMELGR